MTAKKQHLAEALRLEEHAAVCRSNARVAVATAADYREEHGLPYEGGIDPHHTAMISDLSVIAAELAEAIEDGDHAAAATTARELIAAASELATENSVLNEQLQVTWFTAWDEGYAQARDDVKNGKLAEKPKTKPAARPAPAQESLFATT